MGSRDVRCGLGAWLGALRALVFLVCASTTVAACALSPTNPSPTPSTTPHAAPPSATSAPLSALPALPVPVSGEALASPDGTRLALLDPTLTTLTLTDLSGKVYGQFHDPASERLGVWWLGDSSGVFIIGSERSARIMDRDGALQLTAFDALSGPLLSPDGHWIAGTLRSTTATQDAVEIGPRGGSSIRRLPAGSDFLGWLDGEVAYVENGTIALADPASGSIYVLAHVSAANTPREVIGAMARGEQVDSPDDKALIVQVQGVPWVLASAGGLTQLPEHDILPGFWVGPHAELSAVGATGAISIVDVLTGATVQHTPATLTEVGTVTQTQEEALSGAWIAAIAGSSPRQLSLVNYQTGIVRDLGALSPTAAIVPLGPGGRFLVSVTNGPSYLAAAG